MKPEDVIYEEHPEDWPWRVSEKQRGDLLEWFLSADFEDRETGLWIGVLTGRFHRAEPYQDRAKTTWRQEIREVLDQVERGPLLPGEVAPSKVTADTLLRQNYVEHGDHEIDAKHVPVPYDPTYGDWHPGYPEWPPRVTFAQMIAYYEEVQRSLLAARKEWVERDPRPPYPLVPAARLEGYLDDARVGFARDRYGFLEMRLEVRSSSLVGELAYALLLELIGARAAGFCVVCKRPWTSPSRRKQKTCGREECRSALRSAWKQEHPEPIENVRARVRRHRQRIKRPAVRRAS